MFTIVIRKIRHYEFREEVLYRRRYLRPHIGKEREMFGSVALRYPYNLGVRLVIITKIKSIQNTTDQLPIPDEATEFHGRLQRVPLPQNEMVALRTLRVANYRF
jgi:hypothetical protein